MGFGVPFIRLFPCSRYSYFSPYAGKYDSRRIDTIRETIETIPRIKGPRGVWRSRRKYVHVYERPTVRYNPKIKLYTVERRLYTGEAVPCEFRLGVHKMGRLGERIAAAHLQEIGHEDARPAHIPGGNLPLDVVFGDVLAEVKAGHSDIKHLKNRHWRVTFPTTRAERKKLATMDRHQKAAFYAKKLRDAMMRKMLVLEKIKYHTGQVFKPESICLIVNPSLKLADIYHVDGYHERIGWHSPLARSGYVRTVRYEEED